MMLSDDAFFALYRLLINVSRNYLLREDSESNKHRLALFIACLAPFLANKEADKWQNEM